MSFLTNVLYWISTSLLIPVIVILLFLLLSALLMLGGFYGLYIDRLKFKSKLRDLLIGLKEKDALKSDFSGIIKEKILFSECLKMLIEADWSRTHSEKIIADFELTGKKALEASRTLMRVGPMLGLMGTLIPMGPALVGLAAGDIASMAVNMQVAFSTTVVGIFIGAIGYITQLVKQRWYVEDLNNLQYIYELMSKQ